MDIGKIVMCIAVGLFIGVIVSRFTGGYYNKRFNEKWNTKKMTLKMMLAAGVSGALFACYDYSLLTIACYEILLATLLGISQIDKEKMIIPNVILLSLVGVRTIALIAEVLLNKEQAVFIVLAAIMGVLYGSVIFLVARLFGKNGIGMGDIKLFAVIGYFVGNTVILQVMLTSMILGCICGVVKVACKKLSMKDSMSFGPYITAGTFIILLLGV